MTEISVVIADDEPVLRALLDDLIAEEPGLRLVGTAGDAAAVVELCRRQRPDVAVVDVHMPGGGPAAVAALREVSPATRVVACSSVDDAASREAMREAGARAYVCKTDGGAALLETLRAVVQAPAS